MKISPGDDSIIFFETSHCTAHENDQNHGLLQWTAETDSIKHQLESVQWNCTSWLHNHQPHSHDTSQTKTAQSKKHTPHAQPRLRTAPCSARAPKRSISPWIPSVSGCFRWTDKGCHSGSLLDSHWGEEETVSSLLRYLVLDNQIGNCNNLSPCQRWPRSHCNKDEPFWNPHVTSPDQKRSPVSACICSKTFPRCRNSALSKVW